MVPSWTARCALVCPGGLTAWGHNLWPSGTRAPRMGADFSVGFRDETLRPHTLTLLSIGLHGAAKAQAIVARHMIAATVG